MKIILLQYDYYRRSGLSTLDLILIGVLALIIIAALRQKSPIKKVLSHWHHRFTSTPFSPQEFYDKVEANLKAKELDKLSVYRLTYSEGGFLSPQRIYLRIQYKELIYDVCAAPYAKEFFVSWWLGEADNPTYNFLIAIPFIGKLFEKRAKTFFEMDTEVMFKEAVTLCVKETINQLTETKGARKLTEDDWKEYQRSY
ncbi:MAG: hypothetical protein JNK27_02180 [Chitinophagaceae bacterium]|nr:hypothetical protein [Chitinophagaceae bacterium]